MADEKEGARLYGMPDPDNRQPPPEQGLRGEQGAAHPARTDLRHPVSGATGEFIAIDEQSGTAFAEATGRADGRDPAGGEG